jgi:Rrf2 family iron-sulfur cluster assembly transcriptional regulator
MHISTKTEYAIRGLAELGKNQQTGPISIVEICNRQKLPKKYIEQLFRKLRNAKLISSIHGAKGGYLLAKSADKITLNEIMHAVEENISQVNCGENYQTREYCIGMPCGFYKLWNEIDEHLNAYFNSITLEHIIEKLN